MSKKSEYFCDVCKKPKDIEALDEVSANSTLQSIADFATSMMAEFGKDDIEHICETCLLEISVVAADKIKEIHRKVD